MLQGRKLLLADDSIAIQKVIELTFEDEGMEVLSVGDGQQAFERLEEVRPDIVLADVYMPGLNGYQLCEQIKRTDQFRHVPVVLLVGSFEPFNEAEARRVGADDYLTKPFQSIRQMVSKVGSLLSGHKSESEAGRGQTENQVLNTADLELATADTAPLPVYRRPEARPDSSAQPTGPFADMQLDDEMIEARPAGEFGAAEQTMRGSQPRSTESLSAQDFAEMGVKATATGQQLAPSGASMLANEAHDSGATPASSSMPPRAAANDDALLDLDDVEMPRASGLAEADDFILDLQETMQPQAATVVETQTVGSVEQQAETAPLEKRPSEAVEFHSQQPGAPASATESKTLFPGDSSQMRETGELSLEEHSAPSAELLQSAQPEETPARTEAAEAAPAAAPSQPQGQIGLDQLSPEAIDAIARRVVEQLSTKVVEQIAWEVVPQLAELLIKRRLEEGKQ